MYPMMSAFACCSSHCIAISMSFWASSQCTVMVCVKFRFTVSPRTLREEKHRVSYILLAHADGTEPGAGMASASLRRS